MAIPASPEIEKIGQGQTPPSLTRVPMGPVFAGNIAFDSVSYGTSRQEIISSTSFTVPAGKIACILGPSGCGKTTLLKLAAGVLRPTTGRISIDAATMAGPDVFTPPEQRKVGLMFQDFALFPHMTALENVAYGLYALPRDEARRVAAAALDSVGLPSKAMRYPSQLSGGEQQRVALARAIVPRPRVILMDEPFSGLDQRLRETIRAETLSLLRQSQATVLLVTHDPVEALAVADQMIIMRSGAIVQQGTPQEILGKPADAAVARFLCSYNEFPGKVTAGKIATPLGDVPCHGLSEGENALVFLSANDIVMTADKTSTQACVLENRPMPDARHYRVVVAASEQIVDVKTSPQLDLPVGTMCRLAIGHGHPQIFKAT